MPQVASKSGRIVPCSISGFFNARNEPKNHEKKLEEEKLKKELELEES